VINKLTVIGIILMVVMIVVTNLMSCSNTTPYNACTIGCEKYGYEYGKYDVSCSRYTNHECWCVKDNKHIQIW